MLYLVIAQASTQAGSTVPGWATAAIGAAGLVLGIVSAIVGNYFVARAKVREAEVLYRQKLADSYLATAREYSRDVYLPLNILLSSLADAYLSLREEVDFETQDAPEASISAFRIASEQFIAGINALTARGADAYLTTDVEARLRDFRHFLQSSQDAQKTLTKVVIQSFVLGSKTMATTTTSATLPQVMVAASRALAATPFTLKALRFTAEAETLSAPVTSRPFERRFNRDMLVLKASIKLVTLGAKEPL